MPKVFEFKFEHGGKLHWHQWHILCPGCNCVHAIGVNVHQFNGDKERPTFSPSLLWKTEKFTATGDEQYKQWAEAGYPALPKDHKFDSKEYVCHSYVKDGFIQFLSDCTHDLKNQTVALPEYNGERR